MASTPKPASSRATLPIQTAAADLRAPAFRAQAHVQSAAVAASAAAADDQAFITAVSADDE